MASSKNCHKLEEPGVKGWLQSKMRETRAPGQTRFAKFNSIKMFQFKFFGMSVLYPPLTFYQSRESLSVVMIWFVCLRRAFTLNAEAWASPLLWDLNTCISLRMDLRERYGYQFWIAFSSVSRTQTQAFWRTPCCVCLRIEREMMLQDIYVRTGILFSSDRTQRKYAQIQIPSSRGQVKVDCFKAHEAVKQLYPFALSLTQVRNMQNNFHHSSCPQATKTGTKTYWKLQGRSQSMCSWSEFASDPLSLSHLLSGFSAAQALESASGQVCSGVAPASTDLDCLMQSSGWEDLLRGPQVRRQRHFWCASASVPSFLYLTLRFWNQIFTCMTEEFGLFAQCLWNFNHAANFGTREFSSLVRQLSSRLYAHLFLRKVQVCGYFYAPESRQVHVGGKFSLELEQLGAGEGRSDSLAAVEVVAVAGALTWRDRCGIAWKENRMQILMRLFHRCFLSPATNARKRPAVTFVQRRSGCELVHNFTGSFNVANIIENDVLVKQAEMTDWKSPVVTVTSFVLETVCTEMWRTWKDILSTDKPFTSSEVILLEAQTHCHDIDL